MHHWCFHWNYHELDRYEKTKWCWSSPYEEEQWLLFCWRVAAPPDNPQIVPVPTPSSSSQSRSWSQWCLQLDKDSCCCAVNKERLVRTQKHYPAPLAIPLPNYSYDGKELERQVKLKKSETQVKSRGKYFGSGSRWIVLDIYPVSSAHPVSSGERQVWYDSAGDQTARGSSSLPRQGGAREQVSLARIRGNQVFGLSTVLTILDFVCLDIKYRDRY